MTQRTYDTIAGPGNILVCPRCGESGPGTITNTHGGALQCSSLFCLRLPLQRLEPERWRKPIDNTPSPVAH